jgi:3-methyl-2-oxobutanoate hydroxymethyltransferase
MTYANTEALTKQVTIKTLQAFKQNGEKFAVLALYDAPMAGLAEKCGTEVLLVGDSLGMTVLGHSSTLPVTMEHMLHHVEAVSRGNKLSLLIADMPFMSYATPEQALTNAARLMQAGAQMVKLEGGEWLAQTVQMLNERGIPVCAHLGLTPQSVNKFGGFRVQGRQQSQAELIYRDAVTLDQAGADALVLECVPTALAQRITDAVKMPTIGIGAGIDTDGQVLVINDVLGITEQPPKFAKNFLRESGEIASAMASYVADVKARRFPSEEHTFG